MEQEEIVLCGSSAYTKKFYLNPLFNGLPEGIKEDLNILCVLYTEDIGGTLQLIFDKEGNLNFRTECEDGDFFYDEIGSHLKIKQYRVKYAELLENLETYYKTFFIDGVNE